MWTASPCRSAAFIGTTSTTTTWGTILWMATTSTTLPTQRTTTTTMTAKAVAFKAAAVRAKASLGMPTTNGTSLGGRRKIGFAVVKLAAVELVRLFKHGDVARLGRQWRCAEVGVLQGIHGIDASAPVQLQQLC